MVERVDIVVSERGSRQVQRNLSDLASSADRAGDETVELQRALRNLTPTEELSRVIRQMSTLRESLSGTVTGNNNWILRPIDQANNELLTTIRRLERVNQLMRAQASGAGGFQLPLMPQGPVSVLTDFNDQLRQLPVAGKPALATANDVTTEMGRVRDATKGAHNQFLLLNRSVGAFGSVLVAQELMDLADSATVVANRVAVVSDTNSEFETGLMAIQRIARDTRVPVEELAGLYQRVALASDELGASQQDITTFIQAVGEGLAIQGSSANTARGALTQLSQAIGTDIVRAEEFNSILEGAFPIAQAAAQGIDEAAGSVAALRRMIIEGDVTSAEFFEAIISQADELNEAFARTDPTFGQSFTVLRNELIDYIGTSEEAQAISSTLADAIILLADNIEPLADVLFALGAAWTVGFAAKHVRNVALMATSVGGLSGALNLLSGFAGGPVVGALTLIAGGAFLLYNSADSAAEQIERLHAAMDTGLSTLENYNSVVQQARQEQEELGGVINLTTEALLRQSRAELQASIGELSEEIRSIKREIGGEGLNPFNLDNIRTSLSELRAFQSPISGNFISPEIENLNNLLEGVDNGTVAIGDFVAAVRRVEGIGPEVEAVADNLAIALEALSNGPNEQGLFWLDQVQEQFEGIAGLVGGFEEELEALQGDQGDLSGRIANIEALAGALEQARQAGDLVRNSDWLGELTNMLEALDSAEQLQQRMLEALGANALELQNVTDEARELVDPLADSEMAIGNTREHLEDISFSPINDGARGFADQLERAADAAARLTNITFRTPEVPAPANDNAPILASFTGGGDTSLVGSSGNDNLTVAAFSTSSAPGASGQALGRTSARSESRAAPEVSPEYLAGLNEVNQRLNERLDRLTMGNKAYEQEVLLQEALASATQANIILDQADIANLRDRIAEMGRLEETLDLVESASNAVFNSLNSQIQEFTETGKFSFRDFASAAISSLAQIGFQNFVSNPLQQLTNNFASSLVPGLASPVLPGFNEGTDFMVGGRGGVDNNVVAFRASRGERVQVTPAGKVGTQERANITFNITTPDVEGFRRTEAQIATRMQRAMSRGNRNQ